MTSTIHGATVNRMNPNHIDQLIRDADLLAAATESAKQAFDAYRDRISHRTILTDRVVDTVIDALKTEGLWLASNGSGNNSIEVTRSTGNQETLGDILIDLMDGRLTFTVKLSSIQFGSEIVDLHTCSLHLVQVMLAQFVNPS